MEVVEAHAEAREVPFVGFRHPADQLLGFDALSLGLEHDWSAVRVISADKVDLVALHALEAHPDVRLRVLHDVPNVKRAIGVRERRGDEELSGHEAGGAAESVRGLAGCRIPCVNADDRRESRVAGL